MSDNPLLKIPALGQSIWLDFIQRGMFASGELQRYIDDDGLRGVTSNPAIFEKAIDGSTDYDDAISTLARQGKTAAEIYEALTVEDVQRGADLFRPVYDQTEGRDGFVSLEVSPRLAEDTEGTVEEAHRLWKKLDRPNVLIKVPGTHEGIPAVRQLIEEGINVNVTLLFGVDRYREIADAYVAGLQARASKGQPIERVASVASFFLSRIDALVDPLLEKAVAKGAPSRSDLAATLIGKIAIASAKSAYLVYKDVFSSDLWSKLAVRGGRTQRLLWASTSTKNKNYSDVLYVDSLIGPDTVNTVPLETLNAYRDHGQPAARLEDNLPEAKQTLEQLTQAWINLVAVTRQLEEQGVQKFIEPYDKLLAAIDKKRAGAAGA